MEMDDWAHVFDSAGRRTALPLEPEALPLVITLRRRPADAWPILGSAASTVPPAVRGDGHPAPRAAGARLRRGGLLLGRRRRAGVRVDVLGHPRVPGRPGLDTVRYGGNTSCVEVRGDVAT